MFKRLGVTLPTALVGTLALTLFASPAAQARTFAEIYAECGLGAMLFNSESSGVESGRTLAIISNITFDLGTTAISSDASSEENCSGQSVSTAALMMQTYPSLERDLARGEGEYLDALLAVSGCAVDSRPALRAGLRADLGASPLGTDATRVERVDYLHTSLQRRIERDHAAACAV